MNLTIIPQVSDFSLFIFYGAALGLGKIVGGKYGARFACNVDGVLLRRLFGAILVFPLVHLMYLGQLWLDPLGTNLLICTIGDVLIWMIVVLPCILVWVYWRKNRQDLEQYHDAIIAETNSS